MGPVFGVEESRFLKVVVLKTGRFLCWSCISKGVAKVPAVTLLMKLLDFNAYSNVITLLTRYWFSILRHFVSFKLFEGVYGQESLYLLVITM